MRSRKSLVLLAIVSLECACEGDFGPRPPGVLEIGIGDPINGGFRPLVDGDTMPFTPFPNGFVMVAPCLRSPEIDPRRPDPTVTVTVGGVLMAADFEGERVDMQPDGTGWVLWDLAVPFDTEAWCFVCREGRLDASLRDATGRDFLGSVSVILAREEGDGCPDPAVCSWDADSVRIQRSLRFVSERRP